MLGGARPLHPLFMGKSAGGAAWIIEPASRADGEAGDNTAQHAAWAADRTKLAAPAWAPRSSRSKPRSGRSA